MRGYFFLLLLLPARSLETKKMAARKVAAVIGYGPGIGHSCAALWSSKGYSVALVSRTASKLETATTQIPNSASSITAGAKVTPTATAVKNCVTKGYTVRRTLIVKFKDDTLHVPAISRWVGESVKKYQGERGMEWDEIERSGGHFQLVFDEEVAEGVGEWIRG